MKDKKGFIATGLIYSFFLIFLTLFLTSITTHIKNRVSLNMVEDEIKHGLNSHKTIRNFNPGDLISFISDCTLPEFKVENTYIVASIINNDIEKTTCITSTDCLILYSYKLYDSLGESDGLSLEDLTIDISTGYLNDTYVNKILYIFDASQYKNYSLGMNISATLLISESCKVGYSDFCTDSGIIVDNNSNVYRTREIKSFTDNKVEICNNVEDAMGVIYVKDNT